MERIRLIMPPDRQAYETAMDNFNHIAKPLHSLGQFEKMIGRIAGMTGSPEVRLDKKCVVVMCADNGVVQEGIAQSDTAVTGIVAEAMARGDGNINHLCSQYGADLLVVDAGMQHTSSMPEIINIKRKNGTADFLEKPAMSEEDCRAVISEAISLVERLKDSGYQMLAVGEMGIGNTTTSAAIASVILDKPPAAVTGKGAGLNEEALQHKIHVIEQAIAFHQPVREKPLALLSCLGGFDIAGMTGIFLGGAIYRIPVVVDGLIASVAAALAKMISPLAVEYMLPSHVSKEPAAKWILEYLGLEPVITAGMCLGEGTGAVMLFPLLDGILRIYGSDHSFEQLHLSQYEEQGEMSAK